MSGLTDTKSGTPTRMWTNYLLPIGYYWSEFDLLIAPTPEFEQGLFLVGEALVAGTPLDGVKTPQACANKYFAGLDISFDL